MTVTEIPVLTFTILIFQSFILFTQSLFYLSRPKDRSRLRFLILIGTYISHNLLVGLISQMKLIPDLFGQKAIAYASGLLLGVYFLYYVHKEFRINSFQLYSSKSLLYSLGSAFLLLFLFPYYLYGNLEFSRKLYLGVAAFIALVFLIKVGSAMIVTYRNEMHKHFRYKLIAGCVGLFSLCMMPFTVLFGDHYEMEQVVVNIGFLVITSSYIYTSILTFQEEADLLSSLRKRQTYNYKLTIDEGLIWEVLEALEQFEKEKRYLKGKISAIILAEQCGTNTRYLSQIINSYKGKSVIAYINELRIDHAKERLAHDEKFRNYTRKAMAYEVGYASSNAFANAFYTKEKIKLSEYLKRLRDQS